MRLPRGENSSTATAANVGAGPAHALARAVDKAAEMNRDQIMLKNMCGRGDKDVFSVMDILGAE